MSKGELKVTTYLVCSNPMLRAGLGHILANTRYEVREQEEPVSHSDERESAPRLFIVDSNLQDAQQMIRAGATRIGASAGVRIVKESQGVTVSDAGGKY